MTCATLPSLQDDALATDIPSLRGAPSSAGSFARAFYRSKRFPLLVAGFCAFDLTVGLAAGYAADSGVAYFSTMTAIATLALIATVASECRMPKKG